MDGWIRTAGRTHVQIQAFCQGGAGGSDPTPDGQNTASAHGTNTYEHTHAHTHIHIYKCMYRQAHECSCTGRRIDIHVHVYSALDKLLGQLGIYAT